MHLPKPSTIFGGLQRIQPKGEYNPLRAGTRSLLQHNPLLIIYLGIYLRIVTAHYFKYNSLAESAIIPCGFYATIRSLILFAELLCSCQRPKAVVDQIVGKDVQDNIRLLVTVCRQRNSARRRCLCRRQLPRDVRIGRNCLQQIQQLSSLLVQLAASRRRRLLFRPTILGHGARKLLQILLNAGSWRR